MFKNLQKSSPKMTFRVASKDTSFLVNPSWPARQMLSRHGHTPLHTLTVNGPFLGSTLVCLY